MIRKSLSTAVAVAVLAGSAMLGATSASQAGGYGYNGHYNGYHAQTYYSGYNNYYYEPQCYTKKVKFWDYYGNLRVKRVRVCN
ncbi:MAG: hypothetical protein R3D32_15085 [Nitratireductor sp.]